MAEEQDRAALLRQAAAHAPVSGCPLLDGNSVRLFDSGGSAMAAIFAAIASARDNIHMEYYTLEDVHAADTTLSALLTRKLSEGVRVAIIYDAVGSEKTPDALLDGLRQAGAAVLEFRSTNPLRPHFGWRVNDRDHRKLTVVDGHIVMMGGVNMSRVYETPQSVGAAPDPDKSFWYDCGVRIEGPAVAEVQKLFYHTWERHGGDKLAACEDFPALARHGEETIRVDGSAPRERRQLYYESLHAAIEAARHRILLTTGYFVPTHHEWKLLGEAAQRGVEVDLILAGHSDVPGAMHAARALYGRLMRRGVRIHELRDGMLHAKAATIDGAWVAIGSSNLDRRSYVYNNEIDAIVLGTETALALERMLRGWIGRAETITLHGWENRSLHEKIGELTARAWKRYM